MRFKSLRTLALADAAIGAMWLVRARQRPAAA
jgi:hypothetical protein